MKAGHVLTPAECAGLIAGSRRIVALTGAGISTAAGIPDFRGPKGLYVTRRYDPWRVFDIDGFHHDPVYFYEFARDFVTMARDIRPTFTHNFLVALERQGKLAGIATQNIDLLHQQAGGSSVVEIHGSYGAAACTGCDRKYRQLRYEWWDEAMRESRRPPIAFCRQCGGVLKPDIVFFGEPVTAYDAAEELVASCDLLLVLGSSLSVTPASRLPYCTAATTIVVNRGAVMLGASGRRHVVDADLDHYFTGVAAALKGQGATADGDEEGISPR